MIKVRPGYKEATFHISIFIDILKGEGMRKMLFISGIEFRASGGGSYHVIYDPGNRTHTRLLKSLIKDCYSYTGMP